MQTPIRFSKANNPNYPLPPDYFELSPPYQRKARLNAVALRETPDDMMWAWAFFRDYYLNFDGANFYKNFKESPPYHYELISFARRYTLNAVAAPRAGAKSTVIGTELPLLELLSPSIPGIEVVLLLAKDQFVESRFDKIMIQIDENPRVRDDFGELRPEFGSGSWNKHNLRLRNKTSLIGLSVEGKKRGLRPDLLIIDDPEYDSETDSALTRKAVDLHSMLTRQVLGMLDPGARLFWIGTLLSRRSFLYHIIKGNDEKFRGWNRRLYAAEYTDHDTNETRILWESKWSKEFLDERRRIMGEGAYRTEYCNDPRSDTEAVLLLDPVLTAYNLVDINSVDTTPDAEEFPLNSQQEIEWNECFIDQDGITQTETTRAKFGEHVRSLRRYLVVDYAPTQTKLSDYSVVLVLGMDKRNTLWVLDGWQGRCRSRALIQRIWKMARKWEARLVGVEAVSIQDEVRQQVADYMAVMGERGEWTPRVIPIRYPPGVTKADRIAGLEWRFSRGRIKLPEHLRNKHLHALFEQIQDFTPDLSRLPHDDLVDSLSMIHYMPVGGRHEVAVGPPTPKSLQERLLAGQVYLEECPSISVLSGLSASELTPEMVDVLLSEKARSEYGPRGVPPVLQQANAVAPYLEGDLYGD